VRRIGKVVDEQVALYGTLTGLGGPARKPAAGRGRPERPAADAPASRPAAEVVPMPRRSARAKRS
jgi:hypothetical protein